VHGTMHDSLPPNGMFSGSFGLFKLWEISNNMSEMVQDIITYYPQFKEAT